MTVCDADIGVERMDGERITLRLEPEILELIDDFVEKRPEFSNRSHLARVALRAFIEGAQGTPMSEETENRVTIEVPTALLHVMRTMVKEEGLYNSITDVILETLRSEFVSEQYLEDAKKRALESRHDAMQIL